MLSRSIDHHCPSSHAHRITLATAVPGASGGSSSRRPKSRAEVEQTPSAASGVSSKEYAQCRCSGVGRENVSHRTSVRFAAKVQRQGRHGLCSPVVVRTSVHGLCVVRLATENPRTQGRGVASEHTKTVISRLCGTCERRVASIGLRKSSRTEPLPRLVATACLVRTCEFPYPGRAVSRALI